MDAILMWIISGNPVGLILAIPQLLLLAGAVVAVVMVVRSLRSIDRSLAAIREQGAARADRALEPDRPLA